MSEEYPSATCSLDQLQEWVAYTKDRASRLQSEAAAWNPDTDTYRRLKTKAGCFRSLAIEVERILSANSQIADRSAGSADRSVRS